MDTAASPSSASRHDRLRRRSDSTGGSRRVRRPSDCDDDIRRPTPRRAPGIQPLATVRPSIERSRGSILSPPTDHTTPEAARAELNSLENQIERLQMRLMENRSVADSRDSREEARRSRMRAEVDTLRPPLFFGADPSSRPPGGVRLSANMAEGANGSAHHHEDDEPPRRTVRQRLGDLVRDHSVEHHHSPPPPPPGFPGSASPRPVRASLLDDIGRRPSWRRRNSISDALASDTWADLPSTRATRGLWRLEDSLQDLDSELEYDSAARRHLYEHSRNVTPLRRTPPSRTTEDPIQRSNTSIDPESARERLRAVWGDIDSDDYVSPLSSLYSYLSSSPSPPPPLNPANHPFQPTSFRRDWTNPEYARRTEPSPAPPASTRPAAELVQPDSSAARAQLLDLYREAMVNPSDRFRLRRHGAPPPPAQSLDAQKGRPEPLESEEMKLDCECKVCFGQIADTLLLPCAHLVVCGWCADQIGARPRAERFQRGGGMGGGGAGQVLCPMCRTVVVDRIKVFRG